MKRPKKKAVKKTKSIVDENAITLSEITNLLGGDTKLAMFFLEWLNNGMDAKHAYMKLHPNVTEGSAGVLGSRELNKVNLAVILEALGLGSSKYFSQLQAGLDAGRTVVLKKYDKNGKVVKELSMNQPDHKTRRLYHEAQGKMLGFEKERGMGGAPMQFNFDFSKLADAIAQSSKERGLPV